MHNRGNTATTPFDNSSSAGYDYSCYYCHPSGAAHVNFPASANRAAEVSFSGTLGGQTLSGTYTENAAIAGWDNETNQGLSWTNGSCGTNLYCHTNGQGGPPLVTPQVCPYPVTREAKVTPPVTATGVARSVVVPSPS